MVSQRVDAQLVKATPLSVSTVWMRQGKAATTPRMKAAPVAISAVSCSSTWANLETRSMARNMRTLPSAERSWHASTWA